MVMSEDEKLKELQDLILLMLFGFSLLFNVFVDIYLFIIFLSLTIAARYSNLLGITIIILAILKMLSRYFKNKQDEEPEE
jgi:hypothetical protein